MKTSIQNPHPMFTALLWAACLLVPPVAAVAETTNQVLSLDGSGDYVSIPNAADLQNPTEITIEAWVYPTSLPANQFGSFVNKGDGLDAESARTYELRWFPNGNVGIWFFLDHINGTPDAANIGAPMPSNVWTHIATTFDSNQGVVRFYINGVLAAETSSLNGTPVAGRRLRQSSLPVVLGWTPSFANTYASGYMDEVRVWNKARTQAEIAGNMYCPLSGKETNLTGYWNFDNGTAVDLTGNGHDGSLFGNAAIVPVSGLDAIHAQCGTTTLNIRVSQVELCWDTRITNWYQLQYESTLTANQWMPFMNWIAGNGNRFCTNDAVQPDYAQRFYRVAVTNSPPQ